MRSAACVALVLLAPSAWADADAGAPRVWASCVEPLPPGAARPVLRESFPSRGQAGWALPLVVEVAHGGGETVLPQGFRLQGDADAARAVSEAGFVLPDADGGAGPTLHTQAGDAGASTRVEVSFVPLPKEPGRHTLTLPPVPIAVARASGEMVTVCTAPHVVVIDDPTASTPDARPRRNPEGRRQLEEWTLAKQLTIGALVGAALAALAAWLLARWRRRPKPVVPPPPPRPPWEVALEELDAVRHAGLVAQGRGTEHIDRVSDAVRRYLGGRYGFDGLETTTDEMTALLRRVDPPVAPLASILGFLFECDLVKFARRKPTDEDCARVLELGEAIVHATLPHLAAPAAAPPPRGRA